MINKKSKILTYLSSLNWRGLLWESSTLFLAAGILTLCARLLLLYHIGQEDLTQYNENSFLLGENKHQSFVLPKNFWDFYALGQDLFSVILILWLAFCLGLFLPYHPIIRFALWAVYLFLLGIAYTANFRYLQIYNQPFFWSHIKPNALGNELWTSLSVELDLNFLLQLLALAIILGAWFALVCKLSYSYKIYSQVRPAKAGERLFLFVTSLLLLLGFSQLPWANPTYGLPETADRTQLAQLIRDRTKRANLLVNLAFFQEHDREKFIERKLGLSLGQHSNSSSFRFGANSFDTSSKEETRLRPNLLVARNRKYNIVLYIFESMSYSYLQQRVNGKEVTPNWNKLSLHSISFEQHYTDSPLSINSLFSILTSVRAMPADTWVAKDYPEIPLQSLAQILKRSHYRSAYLHTGNLNYAGQIAFLRNRGFDLLQDIHDLRKSPHFINSSYKRELNWGIDDRVLVHVAKEFVQSSTQPYLLVLSPLSPHHPYDIPEEKFRLTGFTSKSSQKQQIEKKGSWFARYLNSLHYADAVLGQIVQVLENLPGGENTLFFIVADHGEAFGQHPGNFNHPFFLYEENIHVPFILYNHRLFPKKISYQTLSRHIDILPTILDILQLNSIPGQQGLSLISGGPRQIASFFTSWRNHLAGIRDGPWKYIIDLRYGLEELYDLARDPMEKHNLFRVYPDKLIRYREYITQLHAYQKKYFETILNKGIDWDKKLDKDDL